jgi:MFS family permease
MAAAAPPEPGTWGACRFCGVAVAPGAAKCGICGAADPIAAAALPTESRQVRRRVKLTGAFRTVIVLAVVIGLAYALISAVVQGPPVVADPLTTAGT